MLWTLAPGVHLPTPAEAPHWHDRQSHKCNETVLNESWDKISRPTRKKFCAK
jgi:hypothetical protein